MAKNKNYLDIGYNNLLQKEGDLGYQLNNPVGDQSTAANQDQDNLLGGGGGGGGGDSEVKDGSIVDDLWIVNSIRSRDWKPKKVGFYIDGETGYAEFSDVFISGEISATTGTIGGWSIDATSIYTGTEDHSEYTAYAGDMTLYSSGTDASIHAKNFYIDTSGVLTCAGAIIDGTSTLGGRVGSTLAGAINVSGDLITDVINARLDSSSKNILSDFNFGTTDYAGAVKSGDITWNTTTGAITGGSGVVVYRDGIVGAAAGVETFSIDATTGSATFAGTLSAAAGTLGTITAGTLTGLLFQTASSGERVAIATATKDIKLINSSGSTVTRLFYGTGTTDALLKLTPTDDARRGIEFIIPSGLGSDAKCITIDNPSVSISIDITDGGSTALNIAGASAYGIQISHSGTNPALSIGANANAACIDVTGSSYPAVEITQNGNSANSYGIRITQGTAAVKSSIYVDNNATSNLSKVLEIDRDGNSASTVTGIIMDVANAGVGGTTGVDITSKTLGIKIVAGDVGIDLSSYGGNNVFQLPDDSNGIGNFYARIPVKIAGSTKYLAAYSAPAP